MIILIGNGQSKSVTNLDLFKNHTTYGCDSIYRKFMPNYLICQDMNVQLELITNNLTKKHKCYFKGFDLIPSMHYAMLKQSADKRLKIGENRPPTDNFIQFAHEGVMYFIWIDSTDLTENVEWWDDEWISDTVALRIACQHNPNETFYCVGYDYYHDQTSTGIYLGSNVTKFHENDNTPWLKQHKQIEEEFPNSKFIFIGKNMNYGEFENLLNK
jgi:hypothetical protein